MTDSNQTAHSVKHATFTIERTYAAAPERVFAAPHALAVVLVDL